MSEENKKKEEAKVQNQHQENHEVNHEAKHKKEHKEMIPKSEYDELNDHYKRILAEFDNYKKRSKKEKESLYNSVLADVIEGLLPVVDNLENAAKVETKDESYKQGIELVLKQFKDLLTARGVEEIKTIGEIFDPELHEAVRSVQDDNYGEKEIVEECRKGYKIGNKVIRHSMVSVAN